MSEERLGASSSGLRQLAKQVMGGKLNQLELDNVGSILLAVASALESQERHYTREFQLQDARIIDLEERVHRLAPMVKKRETRYTS